MPDMSPAEAAADLAYLKRLAVAGRGEPAPFLLLMAVFGGAYGLMFLSIGLAIHGFGAEAFMATSPSLWISILAVSPFLAHAAFALALLWTAWRTLGPRRVRLSRSASAVWSVAFVALIVTVAAFRIYSDGEPATDHIYTSYMLPPVLLVLWGCAWWITAIMSQRRWLFAIAIGSFIAALAMATVGNSFPILLLAAACLLLLAFLPAVLLMRERQRR